MHQPHELKCVEFSAPSHLSLRQHTSHLCEPEAADSSAEDSEAIHNNKDMAKFIGVPSIFFLLAYMKVLEAGYPVPPRDQTWNEMAKQDLDEALKMTPNVNVARNAILFIGDGLGLPTTTSARIYKGQMMGVSGEEQKLYYETFPYVGLSKTYNVDAQVADSGGAATAMLCGEKVNSYTTGVNDQVGWEECQKVPGNELHSILKWSHDAGKSVGVVTNTRLTHATPSAAYAHVSWRYYEAVSPAECPAKDIAAQLIYENQFIKVAMGGSRRSFLPTTGADPEYPDKFGIREDGMNLTKVWEDQHKAAGNSHAYVWNKEQFDAIDPTETDYVLGLFERSHMQFESDRENDAAGEPSLSEMVDKAIRILEKDEDGFFLLVESGRIDHAHHDTYAKRALIETLELDNAVKGAMEMTQDADTLMIVTGDHSHVFTMGGYPFRGNDLFGVQDNEIEASLDGLPYATLAYANGPNVGRKNLTEVDMEHIDWRPSTLVPVSWETHGGEDVAIYARGPFAHLFHTTHEQHYIAHVMAYATCVGAYQYPNCASGYVNPQPPPPQPQGNGVSKMLPSAIFSLLFLIPLLI